MAVKFVFLVLLVVGASYAQEVSDAINSLPPELKDKVDEKQIETLKNKSIEVFKEKCDKNGGVGTYEKVESSTKDFMSCIQGLVNKDQLTEEIEQAKPNGQVDEVFKKYCAKTPQFKQCFNNVTESIKPCLQSDEQKNLKTIHNVTEQLAEFVCHKEGDRIALFIAEGGPECFESKKEAIQDCVNATVGNGAQFNLNDISANSIPVIKFEEKECNQLSELQICVVKVLETCEQPTSANIVDSLFKFVRKATPCKVFADEFGNPAANKKSTGVTTAESKSKAGNSASSLSVMSAVVFTALTAGLLV